MHRRHRRFAARVVASLAALLWGFFWFGLIDLLVVVEQDERFHRHYLFESGWGLLFLVLVTAPLVVLAVRPGHRVATTQLAVVAAAVLLAGAWAGDVPTLWNGLGLAATVALVAGLGRSGPVPWRRPDPGLAALALVAAPAAVAYAAPLVHDTTDVADITNGVSHYPVQAALALALVGVAAVGAVTRHRLPVWTAACCALWLGVESVVYPDLRASLGTTGGVLACAWAVLLAAAQDGARRRAAYGAPAPS